MYNLLDVRDHAYFAMEPTSGNITTSKKIDKKVGDTYEVKIFYISHALNRSLICSETVVNMKYNRSHSEARFFVMHFYAMFKLMYQFHGNPTFAIEPFCQLRQHSGSQ